MKSHAYSETFVLKNGTVVTLRLPRIKDVKQVTDYANTLSQEDTYITLSGETLTEKEEHKYLTHSIEEIRRNNRITIMAFSGETLVSMGSIERVTTSRKRSLHVGTLHISVRREFRSLGLGEKVVSSLIQLSKGNYKLLMLSVFAINSAARSLYSQAGFKEAGAIPGAIWYKGNYTDKIIMYLPL